jgi:phosphatidate cytidylyltransferase
MVIFPTWLALLHLRAVSPWLLLTFAAIIWIADIAAYFAGKKFGKHKLAPAISPGKTIEGVVGGIAGVVAYFFLWQVLVDNSFIGGESWAYELRANTFALFALFVLLALISVVGDLFESWMKRGAGMKDSSNLLPGHGGILDRIDALTSTLPLAGLYMLLQAGR